MDVDGVKLPAGINTWIHILGIHRTPEVYPEPEKWDPARWARDKPDPSYFVPFVFGPRACIGKDFFWLEAKVLLAELVRAYSWETLGDIPTWTSKTGTLHPESPVNLRLTAR